MQFSPFQLIAGSSPIAAEVAYQIAELDDWFEISAWMIREGMVGENIVHFAFVNQIETIEQAVFSMRNLCMMDAHFGEKTVH